MEEREMRLMKGNEAIAEAAIRAGADAFYGYPIAPAPMPFTVTPSLRRRR